MLYVKTGLTKGREDGKMAGWKLELHRDILNRRDVSYPSLRERTAEYESFYLYGDRGRHMDGGKIRNPSPQLQETFQSRDDRKSETPFSAMLALYGRDGNEYTFSRRGMRHMERELPWQGHYHTHDYIEILYVVHGSFEQILLGERQRFAEGEVVITDRDLEHADYLAGEADAAVLFLFLQSGYLDRLLASCDPGDDLQQFLFHALKRQRKEQSYLHLTPSGIGRTDGQDPPGRWAQEQGGELRELLKVRKMQMERVLELLVSEDWNPAEGSADIIKGALLRLLSILCQSYSMKLHSSDKESREKLFLYEL